MPLPCCRKIYESLSGVDRQAPILAGERKLEARYGGRGWAQEVFSQTCYDQDGDRYDACPDYVLPKNHRIIAKLQYDASFWNLFEPSRTGETCQWALKDTSGKAIGEKSAPCAARVSFDIPYPGGARLSVSRWSSASENSVNIKIQDVLIVGMGDSFGAGEGNPDYPVRFNDSRSHNYGAIGLAATGGKMTLDGYPARTGKWTQLSGTKFRNERARWWDRECHRSLYSHQLRAALQLAIEDPQRAVTFLNFSCSGAEIVEGMLLRAPVRECTKGENFWVPGQISALSRELCRGTSRNVRMPQAVIQRMPELRNLSDQEMRITRCATAPRGGVRRPRLKRPIDMIFLSVGGNDVGFVPLVADSVLDGASIYRSLGRRTDFIYGVDRARKRIELLKKRLDGLKFALELLFDTGAGTQVILSGYPNVGYDSDGVNICGGSKGMEVFPPFRLDAGKVGKAEAFSTELNEVLSKFAGRDWRFVDGFREDFRSHGLCTSVGETASETLAFPRLKNGIWTPYAPSVYPAYASRQRWFRTPNDAFLTAHMHPQTVSHFGSNCSGLFSGAFKTLARRHWPPFQLFLASTYGGAFHPTAEGQARMADELLSAARDQLAVTN